MTTVPASDHLARYCGRLKLNEQGKPEASAFLREDPPEGYVSMDWLENLHPHHRTTQLQRARQALRRRKMGVGSTAMLAVCAVQDVQTACADAGVPISIKTTGDPDDPSHTGIYRSLLDAPQVAMLLAEEVDHRMYPAVPRRKPA